MNKTFLRKKILHVLTLTSITNNYTAWGTYTNINNNYQESPYIHTPTNIQPNTQTIVGGENIFAQEAINNRWNFATNAKGLMTTNHLLSLLVISATAILIIVNTFLVGHNAKGIIGAICFICVALLRWIFFENGFSLRFSGVAISLALMASFLVTFIALGGWTYLHNGFIDPLPNDDLLTNYLGGVNLFGGVVIALDETQTPPVYISASETSQTYTLVTIIIGFIGIFLSLIDVILRTFFTPDFFSKPLRE